MIHRLISGLALVMVCAVAAAADSARPVLAVGKDLIAEVSDFQAGVVILGDTDNWIRLYFNGRVVSRGDLTKAFRAAEAAIRHVKIETVK